MIKLTEKKNKWSNIFKFNLFHFFIEFFYFLTEEARALCNYTGNPSPGGGRHALRFQKDDVIKILNNDTLWWKVRKYTIFIITQVNIQIFIIIY